MLVLYGCYTGTGIDLVPWSRRIVQVLYLSCAGTSQLLTVLLTRVVLAQRCMLQLSAVSGWVFRGRVRSKLSNIWSELGQFRLDSAGNRTSLAHLGPNSATFDLILTKVALNPPTSARNRPTSARARPSSAKLGFASANIGPNSADFRPNLCVCVCM